MTFFCFCDNAKLSIEEYWKYFNTFVSVFNLNTSSSVSDEDSSKSITFSFEYWINYLTYGYKSLSRTASNFLILKIIFVTSNSFSNLSRLFFENKFLFWGSKKISSLFFVQQEQIRIG